MTFNTYKTTHQGEAEIHQNKRDAMRAARAEAKRTGQPVKVEILTHAGTRYSEDAVVVRRASETVKP